MAKSDKWITPARVKLTLLLLLGVVLIGAPSAWRAEQGWDFWGHEIVRDVGIAIFAAAFLGLTIERWMRKDFADDVFRASVGYVLPKELREQVTWITGHEFIATKTICKIDVAVIDGGVVRITTEMDREFQNITSVSQSIEAIKETDEWGKGALKSEIVECELSQPKKTILKHKPLAVRDDKIEARTPSVDVPPEGKVRVFFKTVEYKTTNDDLIYTFMKPSVNPEMHVSMDPALDCWYGFGNHGEAREIRPGLKVLDGTLMPHQYMRIRWWPKKGAAKLRPP